MRRQRVIVILVARVCVYVSVFDGPNQPPADSELSYHNCSLVLRVHLDWDRQIVASIELRLYVQIIYNEGYMYK